MGFRDALCPSLGRFGALTSPCDGPAALSTSCCRSQHEVPLFRISLKIIVSARTDKLWTGVCLRRLLAPAAPCLLSRPAAPLLCS
jgi:hypothetical protein